MKQTQNLLSSSPILVFGQEVKRCLEGCLVWELCNLRRSRLVTYVRRKRLSGMSCKWLLQFYNAGEYFEDIADRQDSQSACCDTRLQRVLQEMVSSSDPLYSMHTLCTIH